MRCSYEVKVEQFEKYSSDYVILTEVETCKFGFEENFITVEFKFFLN